MKLIHASHDAFQCFASNDVESTKRVFVELPVGGHFVLVFEDGVDNISDFSMLGMQQYQ